jgi:hypothetical protein
MLPNAAAAVQRLAHQIPRNNFEIVFPVPSNWLTGSKYFNAASIQEKVSKNSPTEE